MPAASIVVVWIVSPGLTVEAIGDEFVPARRRAVRLQRALGGEGKAMRGARRFPAVDQDHLAGDPPIHQPGSHVLRAAYRVLGEEADLAALHRAGEHVAGQVAADPVAVLLDVERPDGRRAEIIDGDDPAPGDLGRLRLCRQRRRTCQRRRHTPDSAPHIAFPRDFVSPEERSGD